VVLLSGVVAPGVSQQCSLDQRIRPVAGAGLPGRHDCYSPGGLHDVGYPAGADALSDQTDLVWGLFASMYIGNVMLVLMNIFLIPAFVTVLRLPYTILMGLIVVFSTVGAFSANNNFFDIWMMLGLGVLGYLMKKLHYPVVPLILALVLGKLAENSLRQALTLSGGMGIFSSA
jgi:putative tricarboxylic transport membrane protein